MIGRCCLVMGLCLALGLAQETQIVITGRNSQRLSDGTIVYSEYFKIEYPGLFLLTADQARYRESEHIIEAEGNVKIDYHSTFGLIEVAAQSVVYDLAQESGSFLRVSAQFGDAFFFSGEELEILDRQHIVIKKGVLTSCDQPTPHWSVGISQARVERDGYAIIKGASFRLAEVPVLYFPFLIMPAFQDRRSGLLIPETGSSARNGLYYGQPLYWAPRRDFDLTVTPWYFLDAGMQVNLEARYAPRWDLRGQLEASVISDDLLEIPENRPLEEGEPISQHRFRVKFDHVQRIAGGDLIVGVDHGSDFQYDRDFLRDTDQSKLRDYVIKGSLFRRFGRNSMSLSWHETDRILAGIDRIAHIAGRPSLTFTQPTQAIGGGWFLRSKTYLDWIRFEDLGAEALGDDMLRLGADVECSRTKNVTSWVHTRFGTGYAGAHYRAEEADRHDSLGGLYAFAEVLGPRLTRRSTRGARSIVQFLNAGLDFKYGAESSQTFIEAVQFDELDLRIADQVDGMVSAWKIQSRLFRADQPFLEMELRQRVHWASDRDREPIELRARLFNPSGYHLNGMLEYNSKTQHIDALSLYGNVHRRAWRGYAGYVRRKSGSPDYQDSLIAITQLRPASWPMHFKLAFDYDFLESRFKSQEFQATYTGSCMGLTLRYLKTPFTSGDASGHRWVQLTVSFKNLGEFGIKY